MDETPIVCRVMPDGEVICDSPDVPDPPTVGASELSAAIAKTVAGEWGPNKRQLALSVLAAIGESTLDDQEIPHRAPGTVGAVRDLLRRGHPPSILLFNFDSLPANVMGAWFLNRADLVQMQRMYHLFASPADKSVAGAGPISAGSISAKMP